MSNNINGTGTGTSNRRSSDVLLNLHILIIKVLKDINIIFMKLMIYNVIY